MNMDSSSTQFETASLDCDEQGGQPVHTMPITLEDLSHRVRALEQGQISLLSDVLACIAELQRLRQSSSQPLTTADLASAQSAPCSTKPSAVPREARPDASGKESFYPSAMMLRPA